MTRTKQQLSKGDQRLLSSLRMGAELRMPCRGESTMWYADPTLPRTAKLVRVQPFRVDRLYYMGLIRLDATRSYEATPESEVEVQLVGVQAEFAEWESRLEASNERSECEQYRRMTWLRDNTPTLSKQTDTMTLTQKEAVEAIAGIDFLPETRFEPDAIHHLYDTLRELVIEAAGQEAFDRVYAIRMNELEAELND